jgi:hypothetical protein
MRTRVPARAGVLGGGVRERAWLCEIKFCIGVLADYSVLHASFGKLVHLLLVTIPPIEERLPLHVHRGRVPDSQAWRARACVCMCAHARAGVLGGGGAGEGMAVRV